MFILFVCFVFVLLGSFALQEDTRFAPAAFWTGVAPAIRLVSSPVERGRELMPSRGSRRYGNGEGWRDPYRTGRDIVPTRGSRRDRYVVCSFLGWIPVFQSFGYLVVCSYC